VSKDYAFYLAALIFVLFLVLYSRGVAETRDVSYSTQFRQVIGQ
jgi:hypothetical protein